MVKEKFVEIDPTLNCNIEVKELQKTYGEKEVFEKKGCSFTHEFNETLVVLGGSGVGKTTILEILLGVKGYNSGSVKLVSRPEFLSINNDMIMNESLKENFQNYYDVFQIPYNLKKIEEYVSLNEDLSLNDLAKTASFGTLRRFALYRTLLSDSKNKLVFLDEPSTGLDYRNVRKLRNILLQSKKEKDFFIITHDKEIGMVGDKLLLLSDICGIYERNELGVGYVKLKQTLYKTLKLSAKVIYLNHKEDCVILKCNNEDYLYLLKKYKEQIVYYWNNKPLIEPFLNLYFNLELFE